MKKCDVRGNYLLERKNGAIEKENGVRNDEGVGIDGKLCSVCKHRKVDSSSNIDHRHRSWRQSIAADNPSSSAASVDVRTAGPRNRIRVLSTAARTEAARPHTRPASQRLQAVTTVFPPANPNLPCVPHSDALLYP